MTGPAALRGGGWSVLATVRLDRWLSKQNPAYRLTCTISYFKKAHAVLLRRGLVGFLKDI